MAINFPSSSAPTSAPAASSPQTATTDWKSILDKSISDQAAANQSASSNLHLDPKQTQAVRDAVSADMAKFMQGPDANDPAKVTKAVQDSFSKNASHEMLGRMQMNYFISQMQKRAKEAAQDMYK